MDPWWYTEQEVHEHNSIQSRDEDFSLCDDPQSVSGHQPDDIVRSKDNILIRSLQS